MASHRNDLSKNKSSRYARAKRYGRRTTIILSVLLVVLVTIGLCGFSFAYNEMIPNVVEMSETNAITALNECGMQVKVQREWSDQYDANVVIAQDPKGGAHVSEGDTVTIVISRGPQSVSVPDLVDISREEAVNKLNKSGVLWIISETYSDEVAAGSVISQSPEAGEEIAPEQNVYLVISKGEKPSVRTAEDVEATKKKSNKDKDDDDRTTSTSRSTDDDDVTTTETTISTSTSRSTRNTSSTSNDNTSSSQSSTSQSSTDASTNLDTTASTEDTTSPADTNAESTGDPGLDEQLDAVEE